MVKNHGTLSNLSVKKYRLIDLRKKVRLFESARCLSVFSIKKIESLKTVLILLSFWTKIFQAKNRLH